VSTQACYRKSRIPRRPIRERWPTFEDLFRRGALTEKSLRNGANHGFLVPAKALPGASGSLALERMRKKIAAAAIGGILS
jgi:hypothetical protein